MNFRARYKDIYQQRKASVETSPVRASGSLLLQENTPPTPHMYKEVLEEGHVSALVQPYRK